MSKSILLAAAAIAGASTIATVYYVSPIEAVETETPPILVDAEPSEVVEKIRTISLERYAGHLLGEDHRERDDIARLFDLARFDKSETETVFDLKLGEDLLMQFTVNVKPVDGSRSTVEVTVITGENRFASNPALHPYDIQLLQSVADFIATDYVSSMVKGHPALSGKRMEHELTKRFATEEDSIKPAARRIEKTFLAAYGDYLKAQAESRAESDYESSEPYHDDYAYADAEQGAEDAAEAAEEGVMAAAAAADAAAAEAREAAR